MRRVVFINRFYWPEETATAQLLTDLASALARRSYQVEVITACTRKDLPRQELHDGVLARRIGPPRTPGTRLAGKLLDYARFLVDVFWHLRKRRRKEDFDTVVVMSDPPLLGIVVWLATPRHSRLIHWIQDIYPEIAMELGAPKLIRWLRSWRNRAWRRATHCVVPSATMRTAVESAGVASERVTVCPNWPLPELRPVPGDKTTATRRRLGIDDKFVAAYSGNLGRVHDLESLLAIAERLRSTPNFILLFIGNGAQRSHLEAAVAQRSLPNVRFIDAQPRPALAEILAAANVHFVTLKPGAERWVFPSKLYGIVSVGRTVILIGRRDSEIAQIIEANGWGLCFSPSQIAEAASELQLLQRQPERLQRFADATRVCPPDDFTVALDKWMTLLNAAHGAPQPSR